MSAPASRCPELLPCPFCGSPAKTCGENSVICTDIANCGGEINWGHFCGSEKGVPAIQHVMTAWNRRWQPTREAIAAVIADKCEYRDHTGDITDTAWDECCNIADAILRLREWTQPFSRMPSRA